MGLISKIKIDMVQKGNVPVVYAVQGEVNTRTVEATLYRNGEPFLAEGCFASLAFKKPDGASGWYDTLATGASAFYIEENNVTVTIAEEVLTVAGEVVAAIRFDDPEGPGRSTTFPFVISVSPDPAIDSPKSENYYSVQTWDDVNAAIDELYTLVGGGGGGSADGAVLYTEQTLTPEQQAQARENIGSASVDDIAKIASVTNEAPVLNISTKTGSYYLGANGEQVKSDSWFAFSFNKKDITEIASALLSVHYSQAGDIHAIGFYNSETIAAGTFMGGYLFSDGTKTETQHVYQFEGLAIPDDCATIVICNRMTSLANPSVVFVKQALSSGTEAVVRKVIDDEIEVYKNKGTSFKCYGEPISLRQSKCKVVGNFRVVVDKAGNTIPNSGTINDGAVYGDHFFVTYGGGLIGVFDLLSREYISHFYIAEKDTIKPHANTACFGNEFYSATDEFPLLYVNAYQDDLPSGTCYALRVQRNGETFTASIVQTITIGFTDAELWLCDGEYKRYGNFAIDTDNSYLYAYMPRTPEKKYRFFRFKLPKLSDGQNVTLTEEDIVRHFDVSQMVETADGLSYPQGSCYHQGKVYLLDSAAAQDGRSCMLVVNTASEQTESVVDLCSLGVASGETEFISIYNGNMVIGTVDANIIDFD